MTITGFRDDGFPVNPVWGRDDYDEPEADGELRPSEAPDAQSLDVQLEAAPAVWDGEDEEGA